MTQGTITLIGIGLTFAVAIANFVYSFSNNKQTRFINTVTTSRIDWINSLRDKVSAYISVTIHLLNPDIPEIDKKTTADLVRERDTLMQQIILHLNPKDPEDQAIKKCVNDVFAASDTGVYSRDITNLLTQLRDATGNYLKKEWEKVKDEAEQGRLTNSGNPPK
jgi:hypothetical protein